MELGDDFFPLLRKVARRYYGWGLDADDLVGEGALRVARELDRYDPRKCPWRPFVIRMAQFGMLDALKKVRGRSSNLPRPRFDSFAEVPTLVADDDPAGYAVVADFLSRLDPRALHIVKSLMAGESAAKAGRDLGLSEARISQLRARIKRDA